MDADTRHQLKQNELAEALRQLVDFSDRKNAAWFVAIVVIALGYAGYKYWGWRQRARLIEAERTLTENARALSADLGDAPLDQLRRLIADNSDPGLLARARLQLAQGLEAQGEGPEGAAKLQDAEAAYRAIVAMPDAPMIFKAAAAYRLGLLYETMRDFGRARKTYTSLKENTEFAGSPFRELADARLDQLDEFAEPVVFEPGVRPLSDAEPAPGSEAAPAGDVSGSPPAPATQPVTDREPDVETLPTESSEPQQP